MFSSLYKIRVEAGIQFVQTAVSLYDLNRDNPKSGDGSTLAFYTEHAPLVDADDSGDTPTTADVVVRVNGTAVTVASIDATQGKITLSAAPALDAVLDVDYCWSSHTNTAVSIYQARANAEILGIVGSIYPLPLSDNAAWSNSPAQAYMEGLEATLAAGMLLTTIYTEENSGMWQQGNALKIAARNSLKDIKNGVAKLMDSNEVELTKYGAQIPRGIPNNSTTEDEGPAFRRAQIL